METDSQNLRDFLRIKQEDNYYNRNLSGMTLNAVLSDKRGQTQPTNQPLNLNRTLLDIIREESGPGAYKEKKSWKHFKDKLRLRLNGSGSNWTPTVRVPASDVPINNNVRRVSFIEPVRPNLLDRNPSREEDVEENEQEVGEGSGGGEGGVRTSLMALLAETDRQMGLDGLGYMLEEVDEDEEEERGYNNCCVCMVRHKGSAFIPCGHTFCRLCSRELFAQRGNCPLCNNYILEILDIF